MSKKLKVTLVKSAIGYSKKQKLTVRALGLKRLNHTVIKEDRPEIRGMINKISHLLQVEELTVEK